MKKALLGLSNNVGLNIDKIKLSLKLDKYCNPERKNFNDNLLAFKVLINFDFNFE